MRKEVVFLFVAVALLLTACSLPLSAVVVSPEKEVACPPWADYPEGSTCEMETSSLEIAEAILCLGEYDKARFRLEGGALNAYAPGGLVVWSNGQEVGLVHPLEEGVEYVLERRDLEEGEEKKRGGLECLTLVPLEKAAVVTVTADFVRLPPPPPQ